MGKQNFAHKIFSNGKFIYETLQEHSEKTEEYFYEIEDDDEYETVADAFVDRLEDFFEIDEK